MSTLPLGGCPFHHGAPPASSPPSTPTAPAGNTPPTASPSEPSAPSDSYGGGCPAGAEDLLAPGRDLAPDHHWLAKEKVHTPVPTFTAEQWKSAQHYDVVVIGAGMSGLHTAWRLEGLDGSAPAPGDTRPPSLAIFERTHHIGGRARTFRIQGDQTPLDLGAMRFIPSQHKLVNGLAEHFKLPTHEFVVGGDSNLQYFRGTRLTNAEVAADPSKLPYHLAPDEQGMSAEQLLAKGIEAIVPGFSTFTNEQWEEARRTITLPVTDPSTGQATQVPLYQMGLIDVLSRTLSHEAITMVTDSVGYHSFVANWDAGMMLEDLGKDFAPGTTYKVPDGGMASFPISLIKELKAAGVPVNKDHTLRQVGYDPDSKQLHLVFEDEKGQPQAITCDKVVLAMPKAPLSQLAADSPFLWGTTLEKTLDKVTANPMTRIFATYDKPWWNDQGITAGKSRTDLPINQVYYYGNSQDTRPYVEVYTDGAGGDFLAGLQNPANPGVSTTLTATPQLAQELQKEMSELHGRELPAPTGFLYKRWSDDYFGGAYHIWNAGSKPFEAADAMIEPVPGVPLYVCGEAFSTNQGWIEGALETSEKVLSHMGKQPTQLQ